LKPWDTHEQCSEQCSALPGLDTTLGTGFVLREFNGLQETSDMLVKIQYDAEKRTFKLVDSTFRTLLEGDALCDIEIPLILDQDDEDLELSYLSA
jgi:hypothetical protein